MQLVATSSSVLQLKIEVYDKPVPTRWKLLAKYRIEAPSATLQEIGKALGYNPQTISMWANKPEYQRYENWLINKTLDALPPEVRRSREVVQERITEYADELLDRLMNILETTDSEKMQKEISLDLLDRAGFAPRTRDTGRGITLHMSPEALSMLMRREAEARGAGQIVDGTVIETNP